MWMKFASLPFFARNMPCTRIRMLVCARLHRENIEDDLFGRLDCVLFKYREKRFPSMIESVSVGMCVMWWCGCVRWDDIFGFREKHSENVKKKNPPQNTDDFRGGLWCENATFRKSKGGGEAGMSREYPYTYVYNTEDFFFCKFFSRMLAGWFLGAIWL